MARRRPATLRTVAAALALLVAAAGSGPAARAQAEAAIWGSVSASRANLRAGPGTRFPIEWVFTAPGLPVRITDRHDNWREVATPDGESGWMHHSLLSSRQTALVLEETLLRRRPDAESGVRARVRAGAVVSLLDPCEPGWCRVRAGQWKGHIARGALWGPVSPE